MAVKAAFNLLASTGLVITTAGNSREWPELGSFESCILHINCSAVSGSAAPTLTLSVDEWSPVTNTWVPLTTTPAVAAITATGIQRVVLPTYGSRIRISWTVTGTTPSFTITVSATCQTTESPAPRSEYPQFDPATNTTVLFVEDGRNPVLGMWNDGGGAAYRDCELPFGDSPSIALDPLGISTAASDPGTSPLNTGPVFKRRIQQLIKGVYSWEGWFRWTTGSVNGSFLSFSLYNRDGQNAYMSRLWLDTVSASPQIGVKYLNSGGTWTQIGVYPLAPANHLYDLSNASYRPDVTGMWTYFRLVTDFTKQEYVSVRINETETDLRGQGMSTLADAGARAMHFSAEYIGKSSTALKRVNLASLIGRRVA